MPRPPPPRVFAIVASEARTAVVFRRGPTKQVRMLTWDLTTDRVEGGQWLSGRLYEERCDLSPDGRLLVYFAGKFKSAVDTFTAVSRPPYFTALALWPTQGTYGGGGRFLSRTRLMLHYGRVDFEKNACRGVPKGFEIVPVDRSAVPAPRHGFTLVERGVEGAPTETMRVVWERPWVEEKPAPGRRGMTLRRLWQGMFEVDGPGSVHSYRLAADRAEIDLGRLDWADWDHNGSLLFADRGVLYRRDVSKAFARRPVLRDPRLVADLCDMRFRAMPPPLAATRWPAMPGPLCGARR